MTKPIKNKKEFTDLFIGGQKTTNGNLCMWSKKMQESQLAVIISAKEGNAAKRNRARRLVKETIRNNKQKIKQGWRMAIKISAPLLDNYKESEIKILRLLDKAGLIEKSPNSNN